MNLLLTLDENYLPPCKVMLCSFFASNPNETDVTVYLLHSAIPGDKLEELTDFSEWVVNELSSDVPVHFTRFHPDNGMDDVPWTPVETMIAAKEIAMNAGLEFVYLGNVMVEGGNDTICPQCDTEVIRRTGYMVDLENLDGNRCACCGAHLNIKN